MKQLCLVFFLLTVSVSQAQDTLTTQMKSLEQSGNFYQIIDLVKNIEKDSLSHEQLFIAGNAYRKTFKYKNAQQMYQLSFIQDSTNIVYLSALGDIYRLLGEQKLSEQMNNRILDIDTSNFNAKIQLANIYKGRKDFQDAFEIYNELHKKDFYNPYYWEKMGFCKFLQDSLYESMYYYANAYLCDSMDLDIINSLCNLFRRTKNYQKGMMSSNDGLRVDSLSTDMLRYRAYFSQKLEFYDSAINDYKKLIEIHDTTYDVYMDLGICYFKTGHFDEAAKNLLKSHAMKDDEPTSLVFAGMALSNLAQWEKSTELLLEAEKLLVQKDVAMAYYFMGKNQKYLGNTDSAIWLYNKSLDRNPNFSMSYYDLANIYDKSMNNPQKAMHYFQKFIAIDEGNAMLINFAKQRIEKIKEELFFEGKL